MPSTSAPDATPKKSWFSRLFSRPSLEEALADCSSPADICRMVARNISYRTEEKDIWSEPEETWKRGAGDCEDFALLVRHLCLQKNFNADILLYYPLKSRREGHAIVSGTWNGRRWMSSSGTFTEVASEEVIRQRVANTIGCGKNELLTVNLANTDLNKFMQRINTAASGPAGLSTSRGN